MTHIQEIINDSKKKHKRTSESKYLNKSKLATQGALLLSRQSLDKQDSKKPNRISLANLTEKKKIRTSSLAENLVDKKDRPPLTPLESRTRQSSKSSIISIGVDENKSTGRITVGGKEKNEKGLESLSAKSRKESSTDSNLDLRYHSMETISNEKAIDESKSIEGGSDFVNLNLPLEIERQDSYILPELPEKFNGPKKDVNYQPLSAIASIILNKHLINRNRSSTSLSGKVNDVINDINTCKIGTIDSNDELKSPISNESQQVTASWRGWRMSHFQKSSIGNDEDDYGGFSLKEKFRFHKSADELGKEYALNPFQGDPTDKEKTLCRFHGAVYAQISILGAKNYYFLLENGQITIYNGKFDINN